MLRTNLSTRPFYNERLVHVVLAGIALVLAGLTVANVWQATRLSKGSGTLQAQAAGAEERAAGLRRSAAAIRRGIDTHQLALVSTGAREANTLIDRRTFSWTELFNRFETTLPADVRIMSVTPNVEGDQMVVDIVVAARKGEDIGTFVEKLEGTRAFAGLLMREEYVTQEGLTQATLVGRYLPAPVAPPRR